MEGQRFGMELPEGRHPWSVEKSLEWIRACGYDFCEISMTGFPLIVEGAVNRRMVEYLQPILAGAGLEFTVHIGTGLDLRDGGSHALHRAVLFSSIDVCARLNAPVLTVHFERASPRSCEEERFYQAYRDAADYARERNVLLCMENIEVEDYRRVLELIDRVDSPNLRMTLDFGHLYLAARYFGGDYFSAIDAAAPYVSHVHIHDNTGTYEPMRLRDFARYKQLGLNERIAFGQGDIHLPVLWGTLPAAASLRRLSAGGYRGRVLLECGGDAYEPFYADMLAGLKRELRAEKNNGEAPGEEGRG